jgi:dihydroorotate dehydrogenase
VARQRFRGTDLKFSRTATSTRNLSSTSTRTPVRTALYATTFAVSASLFAVYYFDARSAIHRYFIAPLLRYTLDAETGHKVAVKVLRSGLGPRDPLPDDQRLRFQVRCLILYLVFGVTNYDLTALGARNIKPSRTGGWI